MMNADDIRALDPFDDVRKLGKVAVLVEICEELPLEEIDQALASAQDPDRNPVVKLKGKRGILSRKEYFVEYKHLEDIREAKATGQWRTLKKALIEKLHGQW